MAYTVTDARDPLGDVMKHNDRTLHQLAHKIAQQHEELRQVQSMLSQCAEVRDRDGASSSGRGRPQPREAAPTLPLWLQEQIAAQVEALTAQYLQQHQAHLAQYIEARVKEEVEARLSQHARPRTPPTGCSAEGSTAAAEHGAVSPPRDPQGRQLSPIQKEPPPSRLQLSFVQDGLSTDVSSLTVAEDTAPRRGGGPSSLSLLDVFCPSAATAPGVAPSALRETQQRRAWRQQVDDSVEEGNAAMQYLMDTFCVDEDVLSQEEVEVEVIVHSSDLPVV